MFSAELRTQSVLSENEISIYMKKFWFKQTLDSHITNILINDIVIIIIIVTHSLTLKTNVSLNQNTFF